MSGGDAGAYQGRGGKRPRCILGEAVGGEELGYASPLFDEIALLLRVLRDLCGERRF